jgi:hypothetical protein
MEMLLQALAVAIPVTVPYFLREQVWTRMIPEERSKGSLTPMLSRKRIKPTRKLENFYGHFLTE